jgi:hypothetical protein
MYSPIAASGVHALVASHLRGALTLIDAEDAWHAKVVGERAVSGHVRQLSVVGESFAAALSTAGPPVFSSSTLMPAECATAREQRGFAYRPPKDRPPVVDFRVSSAQIGAGRQCAGAPLRRVAASVGLVATAQTYMIVAARRIAA